MKKAKSAILMMFMLVFLLGTVSWGNADTEKIFVIKLDQEVNMGSYNHLKDSLKKAREGEYDLVVIEVDTLGGRIDAAEKMSNEIRRAGIKTVAFVNNKAESAGVLLSISAKDIYMAPGGTIGSAETIPKTEKILSYWVSLLKSVAEDTGKDPELVAAMADSDIVIKGLKEKGKLLNLTSQKAMELKFSKGTVSSRDELYSKLKISDYEETVAERGARSSFISFISSPNIMPLFLTLGFFGVLVEVITPGFGLGGFLGILGFSLFFGGAYLEGNGSMLSIGIFILGIILLLIEVMIPGFGVFGIAGIGAIFGSIVMVTDSLAQAAVYTVVALGISFGAIYIFMKKVGLKKMENTVFLASKLDKEAGFQTSKEKTELMGLMGITKSYMRPSGKIELDGLVYDAITEGEFIEVGKTVTVIRVEGSKIIVRQDKEA